MNDDDAILWEDQTPLENSFADESSVAEKVIKISLKAFFFNSFIVVARTK